MILQQNKDLSHYKVNITERQKKKQNDKICIINKHETECG